MASDDLLVRCQEAVNMVPHDPDCAARVGYERQGSGCICDKRDARLAVGLAATIELYVSVMQSEFGISHQHEAELRQRCIEEASIAFTQAAHGET